MPDNVPFDQGAVVTDAIATPYHAITARGKLQLGETVAIVGCGGLGIHAVQLCRIAGASRIISVDVDDEILDRTKSVGATDIVNPKSGNTADKIKEITEGLGVDLALEFVGHQDTIALGVESLKAGGRLVICGLGPDDISLHPPNIFVRSEYEVIGSYAFERRDIAILLELISSGKLDISGSITARFNLEEANTALEHLRDKAGKPIRIVIVQE
ncbi:unnamed protein product [marine sediment metagenome]|uniref:Alcohol dehydrogenase-like C-terminal domain-containing protein n=1 Tax=marine sediment metagenome TaxID=412755 RepID=X1IZE6_9ZZZZ